MGAELGADVPRESAVPAESRARRSRSYPRTALRLLQTPAIGIAPAQCGELLQPALPIGNGKGSLGGIDALRGEIEIDPRTGAGELVLTGGGSDRLSGEFAAVSFSLRGDVSPR